MTEIACTLSPSRMTERGEEIRALGRDGLEAVEREATRVMLRFRQDPRIRERVARVVAAESSCCAFLDFAIADSEHATVVTVEAPEGGEPMLHELADLFASDAEPAAA
jgi:hypothetical protein